MESPYSLKNMPAAVVVKYFKFGRIKNKKRGYKFIWNIRELKTRAISSVLSYRHS